MPLSVHGVQARVCWGYHEAASLGAYTVTKVENESTYTVTAAVLSSNAFRIAQRPLVFVAPHQAGAWRWPIVELQITGGTLTARLGPMER